LDTLAEVSSFLLHLSLVPRVKLKVALLNMELYIAER